MSEESFEKSKFPGMDRRTFLGRLAVLTASSTLPFTSCKKEYRSQDVTGWNPDILTKNEWEILIAVQDILLPSEEGSPGAREFNAAFWVQWVISDEALDPAERDFLKNGLMRVDGEARERWNLPFLKMKQENQEKLLRHVETHGWGESWL